MWKTKSGAVISVDKLTNQHLVNILRQLQRVAEHKRLAVIGVYESLPALTGDVEVHFNRMYDETMVMTWKHFVDDVFQELELEAVRRNLPWNLFENCPMILEEIDLSKYGQLESLVVGALRDSIKQHGNITRETAPSAGKRVMGSLKAFNKRMKNAR
jgi:hypothetical protein